MTSNSGGWLTPDLPAPTAFYCRRFRIPADAQFLRNFWGAILNLCEVWNWEKFGTMTQAQAAALAWSMYQDAVDAGDFCMIGSMFPFASASAPPHTLVCDGSICLRTAYPLLYAALDAAFIIDADHFSVPDMRDNVVIGAGLSYAVNAVGGEVQHTLTLAEIAAHTHTDSGHTHPEGTTIPSTVTVGPGAPVPTALGAAGVTGAGSAALSTDGGGMPHNNLQPYRALKWGIVSE